LSTSVRRRPAPVATRGRAAQAAARRRSIPAVVGLVLVIYPLGLVAATQLGHLLAGGLDFFARRDLVRSLSYDGDPRRVSYQADAGQPLIVALDPGALGVQLGTASPPAAAPAAAIGPAASTSASPAGATPAPSAQPAAGLAPPLPSPGGRPASVAPSPGGGGILPPLPGPLPSILPVLPGPTPTPIVVLPPLPSLLPPLPTQLSGHVQDGATGAPIAGAVVTVYQGLLTLLGVGTATTDANGNYTVTGLLPNTTYTYAITAAGYKKAGGTFVTDGLGEATLTTSLGH
jgi:hypothetical protein